ncbi:MAG: hypothetical protein J0L92_11545 [Deltaproteobacteria bacterium]|nr:hypothetical protein [Deltaproteobacteria bacterium]
MIRRYLDTVKKYRRALGLFFAFVVLALIPVGIQIARDAQPSGDHAGSR